MPITVQQKALADDTQWQAARDLSDQVRLVAGPGTGKSRTIAKRVAGLLTQGATSDNIYVISFTRSAYGEVRDRVVRVCADMGCADEAEKVHISTMHSLALRLLRRGNLLSLFQPPPMILDKWEQTRIYDRELAAYCGCTPTRAGQIRRAHDASWETLNPNYLQQAAITQPEIDQFNAFHASRTHLYNCVLPGELVFRCVQALQLGSLQAAALPPVDHLIVDEFQDLNRCDQEFVRLLCERGAILFVAGDDDQSIYSFRHADPTGIIDFDTAYPQSSTHTLTHCFRCTPAIADSATQLITHNAKRAPKRLDPLYAAADPPVRGQLLCWQFSSATAEARAIAESCHRLMAAGMHRVEDGILILLATRRLLLDDLQAELSALDVPYEPPRGGSLVTEFEPLRAAYAVLRMVRDQATGHHDYIAHRDLLSLLYGVGEPIAQGIGDACIQHNHNFHDLFYAAPSPAWLPPRALAAVQRVGQVAQSLAGWNMDDTLASHAAEVQYILSSLIHTRGKQAAAADALWDQLCASLPPETSLAELLSFMEADSEAERQAMVRLVLDRTATPAATPVPQPVNPVRISTMHGAKGLTAKVVFIPSAERGVMPHFKALRATGLLIEQRRLFYVSVTRAMACCIVSHAASHTGATAMALTGQYRASLPRSTFLDEMALRSTPRAAGLTEAEAAAIMADVNNL